MSFGRTTMSGNGVDAEQVPLPLGTPLFGPGLGKKKKKKKKAAGPLQPRLSVCRETLQTPKAGRGQAERQGGREGTGMKEHHVSPVPKREMCCSSETETSTVPRCTEHFGFRLPCSPPVSTDKPPCLGRWGRSVCVEARRRDIPP